MSRKAEDSSCTSSVWILENTTVNVGGGVKFGQPYRMRHLASSAYLTVVPHAIVANKKQLTISTHSRCSSSRESLFLLYPLDSDTMTLASTTPVRLQHESTGPLRLCCLRGGEGDGAQERCGKARKVTDVSVTRGE